MLSRFVGAALVLVIGGVVLAGEYTALITKADKDTITFMKREKGKKGKGEEVTIKVSGKTTYMKGEDKLTVSEFDELVTTAAKGEGKMKGVFAKIKTTGEDKDETATAIDIVARKGKKKDKTDK
jgi:hypothetical protein